LRAGADIIAVKKWMIQSLNNANFPFKHGILARNHAIRQSRNGRRIRMNRKLGTPQAGAPAAWGEEGAQGGQARSEPAEKPRDFTLDVVSVKSMTNEAVNFWTNRAGNGDIPTDRKGYAG
jgi:hypothetical protein